MRSPPIQDPAQFTAEYIAFRPEGGKLNNALSTRLKKTIGTVFELATVTA
jgi:hypothetical protein